jgi:hypothetical protein
VAGWSAALPVAVATLVPAAAFAWLASRDTDAGAIVGARADERQSAVRLWVRAFAAVSLAVMAALGAAFSAAAGRPAWPWALIAGLGLLSFLGALAFYRRRGLSDAGLRIARLDERQASLVVHALQPAGIAMFVVAAVGGAALSGRSGDTALRLLAVAFAVVVMAGLLAARPGEGQTRRS